MNEPTNPKRLDETQLRLKVYSEPTSKKLRPYIVEYLRRRAAEARAVSNEDMLRGKGAGWGDPAGYICGALAWQGADGVEGDDWITEEDEPELFQALQLSGKLDIDTNNQTAWDELLAIIDRL
ncbi:hypothetical protein ACFYTQ_27735 [Nocardia sp. NPDC004068]|uniref:hypothetical protein n=1 Tax=Nocardia sp. NPDC004068 TaxID=3364303 RepID=UPI003675F64E